MGGINHGASISGGLPPHGENLVSTPGETSPMLVWGFDVQSGTRPWFPEYLLEYCNWGTIKYPAIYVGLSGPLFRDPYVNMGGGGVHLAPFFVSVLPGFTC